MNEYVFSPHFYTAHAVHEAAWRSVFQKLDVTEGQPKVLFVLARKDGLIQRELAEECQVTPATLSVVLKRMEEQGLVSKKQELNPEFKRIFKVSLTEKGRRLSEVMEKKLSEFEEVCLQGISPSEQALLQNLMDRITENLAKKYLS